MKCFLLDLTRNMPEIIGGRSAQNVASYGEHVMSKKGRKRKTPQNWTSEVEDFEAKKKCTSDGKEAKMLTCKYCSIEVNVLGTGKKAWDGVHEHLSSKRHTKLKQNYLKRVAEGKQLTLYDSEVRAKTREKVIEREIHDFVHALSFSAIPLTQADTFLGQSLKKYSPALRSTPKYQQLANKYQVEVTKTTCCCNNFL